MSETAGHLSELYAKRFGDMGAERRDRVWKVLCRSFFDRRMIADGTVLDLACGYGEFVNNVAVRTRYAVDLNPDAAGHLDPAANFVRGPADDLAFLTDNSLDRVFTSNFLEHLPNKAACDRLLAEVRRVLKPGGRFIIMGPNIRYLYDRYWDFYDHALPLSHLSMAEGLATNGYRTVEVIDRFLPFTMQSRLPAADFMVRAYLALPVAWRVLGKQFLITGEKPTR